MMLCLASFLLQYCCFILPFSWTVNSDISGDFVCRSVACTAQLHGLIIFSMSLWPVELSILFVFWVGSGVVFLKIVFLGPDLLNTAVLLVFAFDDLDVELNVHTTTG
eukprot:m.26297 g.26297  ORF g.26297 m.26297 type:complete len:107 (-) comp10012_c0_seq1:167-487(-)